MTNKVSEVFQQHKKEIEKEIAETRTTGQIRLKRNDLVRPWKDTGTLGNVETVGRQYSQEMIADNSNHVVSDSKALVASENIEGVEAIVWKAIGGVWRQKLLIVSLFAVFSIVALYASSFIPLTYTASTELFIPKDNFKSPLKGVAQDLSILTKKKPPTYFEVPIAIMAKKLQDSSLLPKIIANYTQRYGQNISIDDRIRISTAYNQSAEILVISALTNDPDLSLKMSEAATDVFRGMISDRVLQGQQALKKWTSEFLQEIEQTESSLNARISVHRKESGIASSYIGTISKLNKRKAELEVEVSKLIGKSVQFRALLEGRITEETVFSLNVDGVEELKALFIHYSKLNKNANGRYNSQLIDIRSDLRDVIRDEHRALKEQISKTESTLSLVKGQLVEANLQRSVSSDFDSNLSVLENEKSRVDKVKNALVGILSNATSDIESIDYYVVLEEPENSIGSVSPKPVPLKIISLFIAMMLSIVCAIVIGIFRKKTRKYLA